MTPVESARIWRLIDQLADSLYVAINVTDHLERAASTTAQDARAVTRSLARIAGVLDQLRREGGAP